MAKQFLTSFFNGFSNFFSLEREDDSGPEETSKPKKSETIASSSSSSSSTSGSSTEIISSSTSALTLTTSSSTSSDTTDRALSITNKSPLTPLDTKEGKFIYNPFLPNLEEIYSYGGTKGVHTSSEEYTLTFNTDYLKPSTPTKDYREEEPQLDKCSNFYPRSKDSEIRIIIHSTTKTVEAFTTGKFSSNYVIDLNGVVYTLVDPIYRAYHSGTGKLKTKSFLNPYDMSENTMDDWSISISSVSDGTSPFTKKQIIANAYLMDHIVRTYIVFPKQVLALSDWAYGTNPGPYFPWKELSLSSKTFGTTFDFGSYYHKPLKEYPGIVASSEKGSKEDIEHIQRSLSKFGYVVPEEGDTDFGIYGTSTKRAVTSFSLHYMQDSTIKLWDINGTSTPLIVPDTWTDNHDITMAGLMEEYS